MKSRYIGIILYLIIASSLYYTAFQEEYSKPNILLVTDKESSEYIIKKITLSKNYFNFEISNEIKDLKSTDVLVLYCANLNETAINWAYKGGKILYIPGFSSTNDSFLSLIGSYHLYENEAELAVNESISNQIVDNINWMSAPRVSSRIVFETFNLKKDVYILTRKVGSMESTDEPFIFKAHFRSGEIMFLSVILNILL